MNDILHTINKAIDNVSFHNPDCKLEIHMNSEMQFKLCQYAHELAMMDIECDFDGEQYKGTPIIIDNRASKDMIYVIPVTEDSDF